MRGLADPERDYPVAPHGQPPHGHEEPSVSDRIRVVIVDDIARRVST
jgi:hypothetical protein